jgi:hypothetical protein
VVQVAPEQTEELTEFFVRQAAGRFLVRVHGGSVSA